MKLMKGDVIDVTITLTVSMDVTKHMVGLDSQDIVQHISTRAKKRARKEMERIENGLVEIDQVARPITRVTEDIRK